MKNFKILVLCLCLILSLSSFSASKEPSKNKLLSTKPIVQNKIPNIVRPIKRWFKRLFGISEKVCGLRNDPSNVNNVTLSRTEVTATCPAAKSAENNSCSSNTQLIEVSTDATDPEGDVATYIYQVTGGKIIGNGAEVVWDLSRVKTGTYTITVRADDGSMAAGKTVTKEVHVKECSDCSKENQ